jgi:hypothetical protein
LFTASISFVLHFSKPEAEGNDTPPSSRYLNLLIKGATDAGLKEAYIEKLQKLPSYHPSEETLKNREKIPATEALPKVTMVELSQSKWTSPETAYKCSLLGYVFEIKRCLKYLHTNFKNTTVYGIAAGDQLASYCKLSGMDIGLPGPPTTWGLGQC